MKWRHPHSFLAGAGTLGLWLGTHAWALFLLGLLLGAALVLLARSAGRLVRRLDRALPDRLAWSPSETADYQAGVERGQRQALRSAGYEDGKLAMAVSLESRPLP